MYFSGFPLTCPGSEKWVEGTWRVRDGLCNCDDDDLIVGVEALAQFLEEAVHDEFAAFEGDGPRDGLVAVGAIVSFVQDVWGQYFDSIDAIRLTGRVLEIEFKAYGYERAFCKRLCLDGPVGTYDLERVGNAEPTAEVWPDGCTGPA